MSTKCGSQGKKIKVQQSQVATFVVLVVECINLFTPLQWGFSYFLLRQSNDCIRLVLLTSTPRLHQLSPCRQSLEFPWIRSQLTSDKLMIQQKSHFSLNIRESNFLSPPA